MEKENTGNGVAWTALIVAILALILAWSAYNRAGADLEDQAANAVENAAEETADAVDDAEDELDEEFVDEDEPMDEVETDTSINVTN